MDFTRIDMNLLVSLDALLAELNVTKAAARLHISQPALSAELAKLRQVFNDPLLLPAPNGLGMTATELALALQGPLRSALENLDAEVQSEPLFHAFHDTKTFKVAIGDNATSVIGLPLIGLLAIRASENVHVAFSLSKAEHNVVHIEEGEIDMIIDSGRIFPVEDADAVRGAFSDGSTQGASAWHDRTRS